MIDTSTRSTIPRPLIGVVRWILRRMAVRGNVAYGKGFRVGRSAIVSAPHKLIIGDHVSIGPRSVVQVNGCIGDFVLIGMAVQIVGRDDHKIDEVGIPMLRSTWVGNREAAEKDSVHIGSDVWIGASSVVLSGVRIGDGSVIGAGSVVTRDVPDFSIAVGNPARVVGMRFGGQEERIRHLESINEPVG